MRSTRRQRPTLPIVSYQFTSHGCESNDTYLVAVGIKAGNVKVTLGDFIATFTPAQCAAVSSTLERAAQSLSEKLGSKQAAPSIDDRLSMARRCVRHLLAIGEEAPNMFIQSHRNGINFCAQGAFVDPDPHFAGGDGDGRHDEDDEAVYDLTIVVDDAPTISLRFGRVGWTLSADEANWLSQQILKAAVSIAAAELMSLTAYDLVVA